MSKVYLTTTLPYVNADPHIGFALEIIQTDVIARSYRSSGDEVFFNTGTDEHGQKIFEAAQRSGKNVQEYVDHYASEFRKLTVVLNLDNPTFTRTTDPKHIVAANEMWSRCMAKGDIYEKEYEGLYCVGHEAFVTEKELINGKCPDHGKEPKFLKEKNYFFKFKNYEKYLLDYLARPDSIVPDWRRQEAVNFVRNGLEDFSISRERERLSWGIPVPGDDSQVMYVWFDALTNYISTLGWPDQFGAFKKFWLEGKTIQVAGKDQVRFQSLIWQAMLKSADVRATDTIFYHGFITSGGQKMSKSLGNVINPFDMVEKYGTDALRYFLLREITPFEDGDFTIERFRESYNSGLANGLGNLTSRLLKMSESYGVQVVGPDRLKLSVDWRNRVAELVNQYEFKMAMDLIWERIANVDSKIQNEKPFSLFKTDPEKAREIVSRLLIELIEIAKALAPFMPETSDKILVAIKANKMPAPLFLRLD
ncbi:MAG: methionine--tRNA ligase [Candidatus Vogelbacteria bacterium]|nr:methionine--tRNA ligase [Candidatus Vogelbacteria bacterium]